MTTTTLPHIDDDQLGGRPESVQDWAADGTCHGHRDPDLWFADDVASQRQARSFCAVCPVREECLLYALEHDLDFGVWGGLTPAERTEIRRAAAA